MSVPRYLLVSSRTSRSRTKRIIEPKRVHGVLLVLYPKPKPLLLPYTSCADPGNDARLSRGKIVIFKRIEEARERR